MTAKSKPVLLAPRKLEKELANNLAEQKRLQKRAATLKDKLTPFFEKDAQFQYLQVFQSQRSSPPWKVIAMELAVKLYGDSKRVSKWLREVSRDYPPQPCEVTFRLPADE